MTGLRISPWTVAVLAASAMDAQGQSATALEHRKVDLIVHSSKHDVSVPLRDIAAIAPPTVRRGRPVREHRIPFDDGPELDSDPLLTAPSKASAPAAVAPAAPTLGTGVDGVGNGFTGPAGTMAVNSAPPDTTGAVGATQYVQWVNTAFAVLDRKSTRLNSSHVLRSRMPSSA